MHSHQEQIYAASEATSPTLQLLLLKKTLAEFENHLRIAEQCSHVGLNPPKINRFRGFRGWLVSRLGRVVQLLANFVTREQRQFNLALLDCLSDLQLALRHLEHVEYMQTKHCGEIPGTDANGERFDLQEVTSST